MEDEHWDDYLIKDTNVLKNKLGITNKEELKNVEKNITRKTIAALYLKPVNKNFDIEHLKEIHKRIFGSIYHFAGEFRKCTLRKNKDNFYDPKDIKKYLNEVLNAMNNNWQSITSQTELAFYIAPYYYDLIMIRPFREGNGRTIRVFMREFVLEKSKNLECGPFDIDYTKMDAKNLLLGTVERFIYPSTLEVEFMKALTPVQKENIHKK